MVNVFFCNYSSVDTRVRKVMAGFCQYWLYQSRLLLFQCSSTGYFFSKITLIVPVGGKLTEAESLYETFYLKNVSYIFTVSRNQRKIIKPQLL